MTKMSADGSVTHRTSSFFADTLKIISGTSFSALLDAGTALLITRLYKPADLGVFALFMAIVSVVGVIACLRYEVAQMLPESEEDAANLLAVSLFASILISIVTAIVLLVLGRTTIVSWLSQPQMGELLWLIPVIILGQGTLFAFTYWNSRTKHFGRLSIDAIIQSSAVALVQISAGLSGLVNPFSLIIGQFAGVLVAAVVLGFLIWRDHQILFKHSIRWQRMRTNAWRYRKFPLFTSWAILMNVMSWQLPSLILSSYFTATVVGYFALGNRLLRMPLSLIGSAIGRVFFQRASVAYNNHTLPILAKDLLQRLIVIGLLPSLIMLVAADDIFVTIFGEVWREAGVYTQILALWTFVWFISSPLSTLFSLLEEQEFDLRLNILILSTRILSLVIGGIYQNPRLAVVLFAVTGVITYGYLSLAILSRANVSILQIIQLLGRNLIICLPLCLVLYIVKLIFSEVWVVTFTAIIILLLYFIYAIWSDQMLRRIITRLLPKAA